MKMTKYLLNIFYKNKIIVFFLLSVLSTFNAPFLFLQNFKDLNLYKGIKFMYTDKMTIDNIYKQIINFQKLYISNKSIKLFKKFYFW